MNEPKFTKGEWRDGNTADSIVTDLPSGVTPDRISDYYGGYVIAESVSANNKSLIKAAPKLYASLIELKALLKSGSEYALNRVDGQGMGIGEVLMLDSIFERADAALALVGGEQ